MLREDAAPNHDMRKNLNPHTRSNLHISGKLCTIGVVLAALIAAFGAPAPLEPSRALAVTPVVNVLATPREGVNALAPHGPVANPSFTVRATGYNSLENQTDSTPPIAATGTQTRFGIIAVSRDLLADDIPYGSLVQLRDLGSFQSGRGAGRFQSLLEGRLFVVEDTMHARKRNQIDVWFPGYQDALSWGVRQVEVEVVRYGYEGPEIYTLAAPDFDAAPTLSAVH